MNENILELMARIKQAAEMTETIAAIQGNISARNSELLAEVGKLRRENQNLRNILHRELSTGAETYREIDRILHG